MLRLVAQGPKMVRVVSKQPVELKEFLQKEFHGVELDDPSWGTQQYMALHQSGIIIVSQDGSTAPCCVALEVRLGVVLSALVNHPMVESAVAMPSIVVFQSLGNMDAVYSKIAQEYQCETGTMSHLMEKYEKASGTVVAFLDKDEAFLPDALYIDKPQSQIYDHLRIHAPRYLAKAFAPSAWHMVDIRMYDRFEAYEQQYARMMAAIESLELGYIIEETWNREVSTFKEPVGTYALRMMTFLQPAELKRRLLALEYSQSGDRLVDLDVIWHGKKISWKDLLDDKELRKQIKDYTGFSTKGLFSSQNDKDLLVKYCKDEVQRILTPDQQDELNRLEQAILS